MRRGGTSSPAGPALRALRALRALFALSLAGCVAAPPARVALEPARIVDWSELAAFAWEPAAPGDDRGDPPIPASVRELDGRLVEIEAELAPITWGEESSLGFVLTRDPQACCVCVLPPFPEWIELVGGDADLLALEIFGRVRMRGVLEVGPQRDAWGYVRSFYRLLDAELLADPPSGEVPEGDGRAAGVYSAPCRARSAPDRLCTRGSFRCRIPPAPFCARPLPSPCWSA
jgi:hypothetical protein